VGRAQGFPPLQRAGNSARAVKEAIQHQAHFCSSCQFGLHTMTPCLPRIMSARSCSPCIFPPVWAFRDVFMFHMPEVFPSGFSCHCSFHQEFPSAANMKMLLPAMQKADLSTPGLECTQLTPPLEKAQAITPLPWGQEHPQLLPNLGSNKLSPNQEVRKFPTAGQRSQGPSGPDDPIPCNPCQGALPATSRPLQVLTPMSERHR